MQSSIRHSRLFQRLRIVSPFPDESKLIPAVMSTPIKVFRMKWRRYWSCHHERSRGPRRAPSLYSLGWRQRGVCFSSRRHPERRRRFAAGVEGPAVSSRRYIPL